jgi:hypothetical protein
MQTHVKIVAGLFLAFGAVLAVGGLASSFLFTTLAHLAAASPDDTAPLAHAIFSVTRAVLIGMIVVLALPALLCGWGLLTHRGWARNLAIVLAALMLVYAPWGTIAGAYVLWVLLNRNTEAAFDATRPGG